MARLAGISIRNFKAVGDEPLRLRLAPVTLLYGPNGAGKSTILHSLHYAREVLRGRLDVDRTERGGGLDLGGFRNLLHRRDPERDMVLGFELELDVTGLHDFSGVEDDREVMRDNGYVDDRLLADLQSVERVRIEITLALRQGEHGQPYVKRWAVSVAGEHFAAIESSPDALSVMLTELNDQHPVLNQTPRDDLEEEPNGRTFAEALFSGKASPLIGVYNTRGGLPYLDEPLQLDLDISAFEEAADVANDYPDGDMPTEYVDAMTRERRLHAALERYLSRIMVGAGIALRDALDDLVHIGPLRAVPPRGHRPQATPDPARWADGMAGWDRLLGMGAEEVARVDAWLSGEDRLRSGFGVKIARSVHIPSGHPINALIPEATALDLGDLRALWDELPEERRVTLVDAARGIDVEPGDIGVGVSQILPVVVAALDEELRLVAVEQPELHVHPRLQVVLGDLFVEATRPAGEQPALFPDIPATPVPNGRTFLLETHSEHLLLRLLRRIRERGEGVAGPDDPLVTPATISVNYLLPRPDGVRLVPLRVDETGEFIDRWPEGFFAERREELF